MSAQNDEISASSSPGSDDLEEVGILTRLSDGREVTLGFGSLRIGRQRRADLVLTNKTVARHHADVCYESGRYVLYDHSSSATWVNDAPVAVAQPLQAGDSVRFGAVDFRFALKRVPKQRAARAEVEVPSRIPGWPTRLISGGRGRKEGRRGLFRWIVLAGFLLFAAAAVALIYLYYSDLLGRFLP
jgi:pSer/pThr/pTyr-binding forkhead associated (FHA) protein